MSLFKKRLKAPKEDPNQTLQSVNSDFQNAIYNIGLLNYKKSMIASELSKINEQISDLQAKANAFGREAQSLQQKIKAELDKKVAEGVKAPEVK